MKTAAWLLPLALLSPQAAPYTDARFGFTIQPPAFPAAEGENATPVMFFAAPEDGFATNINVQVQAVGDMTAERYAEISRGQFKQMKLTTIAEKSLKVSGRDALAWEYAGRAQGRDLHWLSLAVVDKGRVFLVTATSTEEGFKKHEKTLRASLDSFKLPE